MPRCGVTTPKWMYMRGCRPRPLCQKIHFDRVGFDQSSDNHKCTYSVLRMEGSPTCLKKVQTVNVSEVDQCFYLWISIPAVFCLLFFFITVFYLVTMTSDVFSDVAISLLSARGCFPPQTEQLFNTEKAHGAGRRRLAQPKLIRTMCQLRTGQGLKKFCRGLGYFFLNTNS